MTRRKPHAGNGKGGKQTGYACSRASLEPIRSWTAHHPPPAPIEVHAVTSIGRELDIEC